MSTTQAAQIQTIPAERLCALTGLTDRRHRQLAKEGYFPPPMAGEYQLNATIAGLFKYFREAGQKKDELRAAQTRLAKANAKKVERENRLKEGEIVEWEWVVSALNEKFINPCLSALDVCPATEWKEKVFKPILQASFKK